MWKCLVNTKNDLSHISLNNTKWLRQRWQMDIMGNKNQWNKRRANETGGKKARVQRWLTQMIVFISYFFKLNTIFYPISPTSPQPKRKITKIIPLKKDDLIYKCAVCNNVDGSCLYAVCEGCQYKHMSKKRKKIVSNDECRKSCHHELHNLIPDGNIWWCTKSKINGQEWKMRPQGCALCGGKFCREDWEL